MLSKSRFAHTLAPANSVPRRLLFLVTFLFVCMVTACTASHALSEPSPAQKQPQNIIIILVDDMGFSDLSAFGSEVPTPNIDRLAFGGLRLIDFQTTAKCFPTRASLLTGLYAEQVNRGRTARTPMQGGVTLAESLSASGYRTLMVGKHHGVTHPMDRGFDSYWGLRDGAANYFNPSALAREGEAEPARKAKQGRWWCFERNCQEGFLPEDRQFYATDAFTEKAIDYVSDARRAKDPFFLYLAYTAPHDPLQAPRAHVDKYKGLYDEGYAPIAHARYARQVELGVVDADHARPDPSWRDWNSLTPEERAEQVQKMEVYAGMIDNLDWNIGRLLAHLETEAILEDTLIIFLSDNGASAEQVLRNGLEIGSDEPIGSVGRWASLGPDWAEVANTPLRYFKNDSFNGGVVVPAIVFWPRGGVPAGEIWDHPAHVIDLHPTLLALTGRDYDPSLGAHPEFPTLPGENLAKALLSFEVHERGRQIFNRWKNGRMVRDGRWKLVSRAENGDAENVSWQLFDLRVDRYETQDVAQQYPAIVAELSSAYDEWRRGVNPEEN